MRAPSSTPHLSPDWLTVGIAGDAVRPSVLSEVLATLNATLPSLPVLVSADGAGSRLRLAYVT